MATGAVEREDERETKRERGEHLERGEEERERESVFFVSLPKGFSQPFCSSSPETRVVKDFFLFKIWFYNCFGKQVLLRVFRRERGRGGLRRGCLMRASLDVAAGGAGGDWGSTFSFFVKN